ncbi:hypothetical protein BCE02nite_06660 [Brevibacillus centrosporus]|jgi:hypothetical protein|nr:hypothetical protein BCE02nite_06660 [Brevibacillus centrosporus]
MDKQDLIRYDEWEEKERCETPLVVQKMIALLIMVIPAAIAMYGIKLIRDAFFYSISPEVSFLWGKLIAGILCFVIPVLFIAGFILHHERKKNRVQPRFMIPEPDEDE